MSTEFDDLPPEHLLPPGSQEMVFRIVQEGLANIAQHARASQIWLSLRRQANTLLLEIGDDGQGFDLTQGELRRTAQGGMGLFNVRERVESLGGCVSIWSQPGRGTTIHAAIPLVVTEPLTFEREREQLAQEHGITLRKAKRILWVGLRLAELATALLLLYIPVNWALWLLTPLLLASFVCWLWVQQYRMQLKFALASHYIWLTEIDTSSSGLLSGLLLLTTLFVNGLLLVYWFSWVRTETFLLLLTGLDCLSLVAILWLYRQSVHAAASHFLQQSTTAQIQRLKSIFQRLIIDSLAWLATAFMVYFMHHNWSLDKPLPLILAGALLLGCWLVVLIVQWTAFMNWRRLVFRKVD